MLKIKTINSQLIKVIFNVGYQNEKPVLLLPAFIMEEKERKMYIDSSTIITLAGVLGALITIGTVAYKVIRWLQEQEKQTADIEKLRQQEKENVKELNEEMCLLTYAVLACLKGLKEQGCNGPVTEAIGRVEKHINQKAHGQEN